MQVGAARRRCPATVRRGGFWLFPLGPDPIRTLLGQPGHGGLLRPAHVDAILSADVTSTLSNRHKDSHPQTLQNSDCARTTDLRYQAHLRGSEKRRIINSFFCFCKKGCFCAASKIKKISKRSFLEMLHFSYKVILISV